MNNDNNVTARIERIEEKLNTLAALLPQIVEGYEQGQKAIRRLAEIRAKKAARQNKWRHGGNVDATVDATEKEEAEKRNIPPTPPIKRKGEEEKEEHTNLRARAREMPLSPCDFIQETTTAPTLEQAKSFAAVLIKGATPQMVDEWFADCCAARWRDVNGQPIRNWEHHLNLYVKNYARFSKLRDPDRIYDCRRRDEPKVDPAVAAREKRAREIADDLRRRGLL